MNRSEILLLVVSLCTSHASKVAVEPHFLPNNVHHLDRLQAHDLDGDGDLDLFSTYAGYSRAWENLGEDVWKRIVFGEPFPGHEWSNIQCYAVKDVNDDNLPDMIFYGGWENLAEYSQPGYEYQFTFEPQLLENTGNLSSYAQRPLNVSASFIQHMSSPNRGKFDWCRAFGSANLLVHNAEAIELYSADGYFKQNFTIPNVTQHGRADILTPLIDESDAGDNPAVLIVDSTDWLHFAFHLYEFSETLGKYEGQVIFESPGDHAAEEAFDVRMKLSADKLEVLLQMRTFGPAPTYQQNHSIVYLQREEDFAWKTTVVMGWTAYEWSAEANRNLGEREVKRFDWTDMDRDGDLDIVCLRYKGGNTYRVTWFEHTDGNGTFSDEETLYDIPPEPRRESGAFYGWDMAIVDMTGDGFEDILLTVGHDDETMFLESGKFRGVSIG